MQSAKVFITDSFAPEGMDILKEAGFEITEDSSLNGDSLKKIISKFDALIIKKRHPGQRRYNSVRRQS
ncbi:MAG: hypothetical protein U9R36_01145 [Elusimicrobiota bacterium]|nr:hypothetical protein [Elusimicrobiota bacterium]